ncbi:MAG: hypothetical protein ACOZNI_05140 [Myxococcota bacterium]
MTLLLLAACSEYDLNQEKKEPPAADDTGVPCPPNLPDCHDTGTAPPPDSGTPPDPDDCEVEVPSAQDVSTQEECEGVGTGEVTDPWDVQEEWHWSGLSTNSSVHNSISAPVIGNLTDDDGDGDIDEDDVPDVVTVVCASSSFTNGTLIVLDGATGAEIWTATGYSAGGGPALADVDADGTTDVVAFTSNNRVSALDANGSVMWTSSASVGTSYPQATVADLDADGSPEVVADAVILNGEDGSTVASVSLGSIPYRLPAVGDIDLDGEQEVIVGNQVVGPTGTREWSSSITGTYGHWAAILDADGDPEAEVAMVGGGQFGLYEHDGTEILRVSAGSGQPGPPCVADFDGDGAAEIGWASSGTFNLYELDGSRVWNAAVDDSSGLAACSGYDFDGDGAYEVMFADQDKFWLFDGRTGAVNYMSPDHASGTLWEFPTVADVDNDGSAEIVYVSNDYGFTGWNGVTVLGHAGDGWPKSGTTWHVHDFAVTNINADGTVPAVPDPPWQVHNVYRARPAVDIPASADLRGVVADVCVADCDDGPVRVALQAYNEGAADVEAGAPWALYRDDGGTLTLVTTGTLPAIAAGRATDGWEVELTLADVGTDGFVLRVDDDGTGTDVVGECEEDDNEDAFRDTFCP